jgi:hypothetical protein
MQQREIDWRRSTVFEIYQSLHFMTNFLIIF